MQRKIKCKICGKEHSLGGCPEFQSTASRMDVRRVEVPVVEDGAKVASAGSVAGTQALPVDTLPKPKMGRPRTGYIKAEYNRQYSADLRTIKRLGLEMTVTEWRNGRNQNPSPPVNP